MRFDPHVAEWSSCVKNPRLNLVEKTLKMAQILEYPNLDVEEYVGRIGRIGISLREQAWGAGSPAEMAQMLSTHLFDSMGFSADDASGRFLNDLIDRRRGSAMCMAVLHAEVARLIGLDAAILRDAGSVMVECGGIVLDVACARLLPQGGMRRDASVPMSQEHALMWMMRDIREAYTKMLDYGRARRCADMILAVKPESAPDIRDRGILESRMPNPEPALQYLTKYLSINPDADDVDFVLELIEDTKQRINQQ